MFERFTERARRVIFFSRWEASQGGSITIETEHLLLGLLREDENVNRRFVPDATKIESIRSEIERQVTRCDKKPASIDLPLSDEFKRILAFAGEEATRLNHRSIGTEHLLVGLLREENCVASKVLRDLGLEAAVIQGQISVGEVSPDAPLAQDLPDAGFVPNADTAMRIAEAVWIPLYGLDTVKSQGSFRASLLGDVWTVQGSLATKGTADSLIALLSKSDGRILKVYKSPGTGSD